MLAQMSNIDLTLFIVIALAVVVGVVIVIVVGVTEARKNARGRALECARTAEEAEWERCGVKFTQLPKQLQAVMIAIAAVREIPFPKSIGGIVFVDLAESHHDFICDICGTALTGWTLLYRRYTFEYEAVCMDQRACFTRAQAILDDHLAASRSSHEEAIKVVAAALSPQNTDGTEKPSGKEEGEEEGCNRTRCEAKEKADKKEEA